MEFPVTVIIPVYNGLPFLKESINSILAQTYENFCLLIIDDGSTDGSLNYLDSINDERVIIKKYSHQGLCNLLNLAMEEVETEFVARLDQDDISLPDRLEKEMNFLIHNPEYAAVLSQFSRIGEHGKEFGYYKYGSPKPIEDYDPHKHGAIANSTLCIRRNAFLEIGGYRQEVYPVDDLDLLIRLWERGKLAVLNTPLIKYRIHGKAATFKTFREMQLKHHYVVAMSELRNTGQQEIPFKIFMENYLNLPFWIKTHRYFKETGMLLFRQAGAKIGQDKYIHGALLLALAFCYNPRNTIRRLMALRHR